MRCSGLFVGVVVVCEQLAVVGNNMTSGICRHAKGLCVSMYVCMYVCVCVCV